MAVDEKQLKKLGSEFGDLAHLISLEWRLRATPDPAPTHEYVRSRPLLSRSYSISLAGGRNTHRLHGWGETSGDGVAEVFVTDFLRGDEFELTEPTAVSFVATAESSEPVVVSHTVEVAAVTAPAAEIATHYTVEVRAWDLSGAPVATRFSWHATVDVEVDGGLIGG